jgi:ATP-binding cassette subfamily B (MDR/TAP) protein 1
VLGQYTHELDSALAGTKRPVFTIMICFAFTQSIEYWFMALGFWYGCRLLSLDEISMYAFFIAFLGVFFSGQSAAQLFQFSSSITKGINAANYVFWLQDLQPTIRETDENSGNGPGSGNTMNIHDVRFSYPLRPCTSILKGISLHVSIICHNPILRANACIDRKGSVCRFYRVIWLRQVYDDSFA